MTDVTGSGSSAEDETTQDKVQFHLIMVAWGDTTELRKNNKRKSRTFQ